MKVSVCKSEYTSACVCVCVDKRECVSENMQACTERVYVKICNFLRGLFISDIISSYYKHYL